MALCVSCCPLSIHHCSDTSSSLTISLPSLSVTNLSMSILTVDDSFISRVGDRIFRNGKGDPKTKQFEGLKQVEVSFSCPFMSSVNSQKIPLPSMTRRAKVLYILFHHFQLLKQIWFFTVLFIYLRCICHEFSEGMKIENILRGNQNNFEKLNIFEW